MILDVLTANWYVHNQKVAADAALMRRLAVDVAGCQEALRAPKNIPGYRRYVGGRDGTRYPRMNATYVTTDGTVKVLDHRDYRVTKPKRRTRVVHRRHIKVTYLVKAGVPVAFFNTHRDAGVQKGDGRIRAGYKGTYWSKRHMKALLLLIADAEAAGWVCVIVGDFNYRLRDKVRQATQAWKWSPQKALGGIGFTFTQNGLDYVLYRRKQWQPIQTQKHHPKGADHLWVEASLRFTGAKPGKVPAVPPRFKSILTHTKTPRKRK